VDYVLPGSSREFGTVYLGADNVAGLVVAQGLAKVCCFGEVAMHILLHAWHINSKFLWL
jgi:hypothetical protein